MILLKTRCGCTRVIEFFDGDREVINIALIPDPNFQIGEDMSYCVKMRKRRFFNTGNYMKITGDGEYIPIFLEEWREKEGEEG